MRLKTFLILSSVLLTLTACGTQKIDINRSQLMPVDVAKDVLTQYYGSEWVKSPTLESDGPRWCEKGKKKSISYSDINDAVYVYGYGFSISDAGEGSIKMGLNCIYMHKVNVNGKRFPDVAAALTSLGANIQSVYWAR
ncbi:hypothetical protein V5T82_15035 [Magnetovibrio sp. PR-2]|uniref:hypothetical protein n=1 Tax=Magnetovibrio sp. PR-2 TaxID=3120356 RepID=UPI002FCE62E3